MSLYKCDACWAYLDPEQGDRCAACRREDTRRRVDREKEEDDGSITYIDGTVQFFDGLPV